MAARTFGIGASLASPLQFAPPLASRPHQTTARDYRMTKKLPLRPSGPSLGVPMTAQRETIIRTMVARTE
jgi:hypothetical protein